MATIIEKENFDVSEFSKRIHQAIWGVGANKFK